MTSWEEKPLELDAPPEVSRRPTRRSQTAEVPPAPARRWLRLILLLALLGLVGWESIATFTQHLAAPTTADWQAAAVKVRQERKPGEPALFAPTWVDPLGRLHLGDQLEMDLLTRSDVDSFARAFEVSIRDKHHAWLAGWKRERAWTLGAITVAAYVNPAPAQVLYDFTRRIREAQVDRIGPQVLRCPWQEKRFVCEQARSWNWVGPHLAEVGHRPYRAIFAHAVDGHVMRITFPSVPVGSTLVGYTGIDDFENRKRSQTPVLLKILIGPKVVATIQHPNDGAWPRFTVDTREHAGQTHPVSFEVTSPLAYARTFCFSAETRK